MQYLGGKTRLAGKIVEVAVRDARVDPSRTIAVDGCCGGMSVSVAMVKIGFRRVIAFDDRLELINMWRAVFAGWTPPEVLSEQEYSEIKTRADPEDPLTAFAMFGCSFGAMAWGSYARNARGDNYARQASRGIMRKAEVLRGKVEIVRARYETFDPPAGLRYLDPPYEGTIPYKGVDFTPVWPTAREWGAYVSEYKAPVDFERIWSAPARADQMAKEGAMEGLFRPR